MSDEATEPTFSDPGPRLGRSRGHTRRCHTRWLKDLTRSTGSPDYDDAWYATQCGGCRFYVRLTGQLHSDWGVCTNPASPRDGRATFEHDGCDAFVPADEGWG